MSEHSSEHHNRWEFVPDYGGVKVTRCSGCAPHLVYICRTCLALWYSPIPYPLSGTRCAACSGSVQQGPSGGIIGIDIDGGGVAKSGVTVVGGSPLLADMNISNVDGPAIDVQDGVAYTDNVNASGKKRRRRRRAKRQRPLSDGS